MRKHQPPFDGKPCPCCPVEIRNLVAVISNLLVGSTDTTRDDLQRAVDAVKPLMDAHFADRMHSHGEVER